MNPRETKIALDLIKSHPDCIAWLDLGDKGNACTGRLDILTSQAAIINNALSLANVKQAMPKYSKLHLSLSSSVARILNQHYVPYDYLCKIIGRLLESNFKSFYQMITLSINVRSTMKQKGLTQIESLNEVLF